MATTTPTRPLSHSSPRKNRSTPAGKIALARVLARDGEFDAAGALARQLWREEDFNETIEGVLRKEFSDFLTVADHKYRADRLLYAEKNAAAMRAAELAGKDVVASGPGARRRQ